MTQLAGKSVVVTGAGAGIGRASAELFAKQGARVCCADRDGNAAGETADRIRTAGGEAIAQVVDVASEEGCHRMVEATISAFAGIDGLFANAGVYKRGAAVDLSLSEWNQVMAVNLTGVFLCAREVLPVMVRQGSGSIVTLASVAGMIGHRESAAYAASKGGVLALTRQLAADYARSGIRVNAVCPGTVRTSLAASAYSRQGAADGPDVDRMFEKVAKRYPTGRLGQVDDVAQLVAFLLSDAANWITAATYPVDGGLTGCY
jgi:NAD(P)-dependent dehydrogenase (short-subunit alcohol dehydrogenase family)